MLRQSLLALAAFTLVAADNPQPRKIAVTRVYHYAEQIGIFVADADGSGERPLLSSPDVDYDPVRPPASLARR